MITVPPFAALWRAGVAGIFGATSGFAVFVLWWEQRDSHQSPLIFLLALLVAAGMSFAFESFRATVEGHQEDRARLPDTVVTIALLAVFEVFILGLHASISLLHHSTRLDEVSGIVLGPGLAGQTPTHLNLVIIAAVGERGRRAHPGAVLRGLRSGLRAAPDVFPFDLTDEWKDTLRKEQRDFAAARQAFEAKLRATAAVIRSAHDRLVQHLDQLAKIRAQVHEQIEWASLFELAMTASFGFWATIGLLAAWTIRHGSSHRLDVDPGN